MTAGPPTWCDPRQKICFVERSTLAVVTYRLSNTFDNGGPRRPVEASDGGRRIKRGSFDVTRFGSFEDWLWRDHRSPGR